MQKICSYCQISFEVRPEDLAFYDRVSPTFAGKKFAIPAPTLCPTCRWQRRMTFRNERTLYHGTCALTGKSMISMHHPEKPYPVYQVTEWLSDKWNPLDYGRDFDFSRPFFEQFKEMCDQIPHFNLFVDPHMDINSDYTNCSSEAKNCYLISQAEINEDCYYSRGINRSKDCCDCLRIGSCELCYESINLNQCYHCIYCQDCENCSDCSFSTDLKGCKNCFGCHGLVQKEYYFFNQPLSKEEWESRVKSLVLTPALVEELQTKSEALRLKVPHRANRITQCENVTGDHLFQCKNCRDVYDSRGLEECTYTYEIHNGAKYCMDYSMWGNQAELLYECSGCGYNVYNTLFTNHCWQNISNLIYCDSCFPSVKDCFGCFGLKRKQYCILNKQYTKEEYEVLVGRIIEHMQKTGEWGEFFPASISPYGYNESIAQSVLLLTREQVKAKGWNWYEKTGEQEAYIGPDIQIPEKIIDVPDEITERIFRCRDTGKLYKVIPQELAFYRKLGLPIPLVCPEERYLKRTRKRTPRFLWSRSCAFCGQTIQTTYAPERLEIIYCEECYLKTVY